MDVTKPDTSATGTATDYKALYLRTLRRLEREQQVRREAEAIAERGLRELYEREQQKALLESIARHANGTSSQAGALRFALEEICRHAGFVFGCVYLPWAEDPSCLMVSSTWHVAGEGLDEFLAATLASNFPLSTGLPGRVRSTARSHWIRDVADDGAFLRKDAATRCGLRAAVAFPIMVVGSPAAVVEFFSREALDPDTSLLGVLGEVAVQLGYVFERARLEGRLIEDATHEATHDALTGLPNRSLLLERIDRAVKRTAVFTGSTYAVLFADLDRFKLVNDSLGHATGDALLVEAAARFAAVAAEPAVVHTLARLGADQFALLVEDVADEAGTILIAERLLAALQRPFTIGGHDLHGSASIGVVFGRSDGIAPQDLLRDAELAMDSAKTSGRSRVSVFDPSLQRQAALRLAVESDLRCALRDDAFVLHYQPVVALGSGQPIGFEALVRWQRTPGTLVFPNDFIPIAEDSDLIVPLGHWVLAEACRAINRWNATRAVDHRLWISVNASTRQFQRAAFVDEVLAVLDRTGTDPRTLKIEITESAAMVDMELAVTALQRLRAVGIGVSIDDFGTGYSSLSYLNCLPFDTLKIDRSFVHAMGREGGDRQIIRTILDLADNLKLDVVAEGTETLEDVETLRMMGCAYAQGYYFSKPVEAGAIEAMLAAAATTGLPIASSRPVSGRRRMPAAARAR